MSTKTTESTVRVAHTPGPWRLSRRSETPSEYLAGDTATVWAKGEYQLVLGMHPATPAEGLANAALIREAPALLEACRMARDALGMIAARHGRRPEDSAEWCWCNEAIAKATEVPGE